LSEIELNTFTYTMGKSLTHGLAASLLLTAIIIMALQASFATADCTVENCVECDSSNETCNICADRFVQVYGLCVACRAGCPSCLSTGTDGCDTCLDRQGLTSPQGIPTADCWPCIVENCAECYANNEVCEKCADRFLLSNETCIACPTGCPSCQLAGPDGCDTCLDTQGLTSPQGIPPADCDRCTDENCLECYANNAVCEKCMGGFFLLFGRCGFE